MKKQCMDWRKYLRITYFMSFIQNIKMTFKTQRQETNCILKIKYQNLKDILPENIGIVNKNMHGCPTLGKCH